MDLSLIIRDFNVKTYEDENIDVYNIIADAIGKITGNSAFYIINLTEIIDRHKKWMTELPLVKPFYAVKCNPNTAIIRLLATLGCGFDCASKDEISTVLRSGVEPANIIFANPCKDQHFIQYARASDVDLLTFDDENELYKIKLYHPRAKLLIRIKTDDSKSRCRFNSKFGVDLETAKTLVSLAKTLQLDVVGVSFHAGSSCSSVEPYVQAFHDIKELFDYSQTIEKPMNIIDIGGGFSARDDYHLFEEIAAAIRTEIKKFSHVENLTLIAEPGRFFVESSHTLLFSVIGKKCVQEAGKRIFKYYTNDGVYGSFNCILFDQFKPKILPYNERDGVLYDSVVFGPTCDSLDTIDNDIKLPELAIGEWLYVENMGAYSSSSSTTFNGLNNTTALYIMTAKSLNLKDTH